MAEKVEFFLINVAIIEGRHLAWPNMDSAVHVMVDNQKKCTAISYSTDQPFFNEFFMFEFYTTFQALMDKSIKLSVIQPGKIWRSRKTLGYVTLDTATVWSQPDRQFYHKWAVISAPFNDPVGGPRGYIKVDINILRKGESPKIPITDAQETDEIEGNLLLPEGMTTERQRAHYIFNIYRGENLLKEQYLDSITPHLEKDAPSTYIEVFFAGLKVRTSTRKANANPEWNESLTITELFPPLCQRITIHLGSSHVSNEREHGFLPKFGPSFLHFYGKGRNCEGYVGKILMSFSTDLQVNTVGLAKSVHIDTIPRLSEENLWKTESVLLYATIFNANLIGKKYADKSISYELHFGNLKPQSPQNGEGDTKISYTTPPLQPKSKDRLYWYLNYGQDKPSMHIIGNWPDFRQRLYNSNMITKVVDEYKLRLDKIEGLFLKEETKVDIQHMATLLLEAIDFLCSACRKYLDITQGKTEYSETELDRERSKICLREMEEIEIATKKIYKPKMKKKCFVELKDLLGRLELLAEDAQDCWPDVYITMVSGNKNVAFEKCTVKDIIYSVVDEEKGKYCGAIQNLFLTATSKKPQPAVACKLDLFLWMGLERHKKDCFEAFPQGFKRPSDSSATELPRYLIAEEKHYFQCRAHIYQGQFLPGSDRSGLCDPFVRVVVKSDCRATTVSKATLNPVWDQTLVYRQIIVYGASSYIKANPPIIVMEIFDQDDYSKVEFVGRCTLKPVLKFLYEPYAPPLFPPKLSWYKVYKCKDILGEILAVVEFMETSETPDEKGLIISNEIVGIPSDIKPSMVKYRLEVIFWGVRNLHKIDLLAITKPKITIECGYVVLHSDMITDVHKSLNFSQTNKQMEVSLPDQEEYAPPICIKLFDCRSFGRYTLAATHIASLKHFLYYPLTEDQRLHKFMEIKPKLESVKSKRHVAVPMAVYESDDKNSSLQQRKPLYRHWLDKLFNRDRKSDSNGKENKDRQEKTGDKSTTTDEELAVQRPLLGAQSETTETTSSGNTCTCKTNKKTKKEKRPKKKKKTDQKVRKLKSKSSGESTSTSGKSSSTGKSSRYPLKRKKGEEISTSADSIKAKKPRNKTKVKKQKKKSKEKITTSDGSSSKESEKPASKAKAPKTDKNKKKKKNKTKQTSTDDTSSNASTGGESYYRKLLKRVFRVKPKPPESTTNKNEKANKVTEPEEFDWWTKYYDSMKKDDPQKETNQKHLSKSKPFASHPKSRFLIYPDELESQPEFENFNDTIQTFQMYRGKRTGDEIVDDANITGVFKGFIKIYRWPPLNNLNYVTDIGTPLNDGVFQNYPSNEPIEFLLRIYCVKGINLRPKDSSGRSDPYIIITMRDQVINDKSNYVSQQISPSFGRCFELNGTFPNDNTIAISVWDWDLSSADDLIGETKIDIENRFYTRHRAHCGISNKYEKNGVDLWRDEETPSQILANLCTKNNIDPPVYTENCVKILLQEFYASEYLKQEINSTTFDKEQLALNALHHWQEVPVIGCCLVPEHVETRSLYHPSKAGVEQGKLQLWIDIFPSLPEFPPPPKINIEPRKPVDYELRVIIWNTEDVILEEDDFFVGEKMSDIYVKGWLTGPEESQCTDVHYRSMTGEGSFNWRFVFRFKYLSSENKLVKTKKESLFSVDQSEVKLPCRLSLQIWDNDTISADDFLGMVVLELASLPRGARSAKMCTLKNLEPNTPTINLFKTKRTKCWWPFRGQDEETKAEILAGKVEAEFELIPVEEADKNPVGRARAEPQPLPKPLRPETSFSWFKNPLKAIKFLVCKHYRWKMIKCIILILLILALGLAIYAFPGYLVKKLLGV